MPPCPSAMRQKSPTPRLAMGAELAPPPGFAHSSVAPQGELDAERYRRPAERPEIGSQAVVAPRPGHERRDEGLKSGLGDPSETSAEGHECRGVARAAIENARGSGARRPWRRCERARVAGAGGAQPAGLSRGEPSAERVACNHRGTPRRVTSS